jgi:hypothetical protein
MTHVVMDSAPISRAIASSSYGFVRFCGGAIAPFVAGKLGETISVEAPFYFGAAMTAIAVGVLCFYRTSLVPATDQLPRRLPMEHEARGSAIRVAPRTLVIAVGVSSAREVCAMAAPLALAQASIVHVLHVIERDIIAGEDAVDLESNTAGAALLEGCVTELRRAGVPVVGELLHSIGTHADVAERILDRAAELSATTIVLGPETHSGVLAVRVGAEVASRATSHVVVVHPEAGPLMAGSIVRPKMPSERAM